MNVRCEYSKIVIPIDFKYSEIAGKYTGAVAEKFGFDETNVQKIIRCTEQAVSWVIDYTYHDQDKISIEVSCEIIPEGFKISVKDKGLPFDPSQLKDDEPEGLSGILQLKKDIDEIVVRNLGPEGKEIVLIKYSEENKITDYYNTCELDLYDPPEIKQASRLKTNCTVRPLSPGEAIEVSKCIYKGYRYTYAYDHVYYPEKLIELNKNNTLYSAVAVTETGEIAGHCALHYENRGDPVAEIGLGVVKPEFRSQGCFNRLTEFLIEKAESDKLMGIYGQAVTNHTYSQQAAAHHNLRDCALLVGYIPASVNFKGVDKMVSQRISVFFCFLYFNRSVKPDIYPPKNHTDMIGKLYEHLGVSPVVKKTESPGAKTLSNESVVQIKVMNSMGFARIIIEKHGRDMVAEVRKRLKELCLKKIEVISVYLGLSDPLTPCFSGEMETLGFFFSGILPGAMPDGGDAVILQYLNNVAIYYEEIKAHSDMAKELIAYVKKHDPGFIPGA